MQGILEKKEDGWYVKWSDTHSWTYGTHWMWTPLHPTEIIDESKFKDGDIVEFEHIVEGYDKENFTPFRYVKLINKKEKNMTKITDFVPYEPKKENRFIVEFGEPFKIPKYVIHRTTRPTLRFGKWDDMIFEMYDPITPSTSQALMDGIRELRNRDDKTIEVKIKMLSPVGDTVEEWVIKGSIDMINFGHLDYSSDNFMSITLYLKTISAILAY